jgi:hypothetical protein
MTNLTNDNGKVNKKIRPVFRDVYKELGFHDDFHYEPSLESQISSWRKESEDLNSGTDDRFTINRCPEAVRATIYHLRGKHQLLPTQTWVEKFCTRSGIIILEKLPSLKIFRERRRLLYESGEERDRVLMNQHHDYPIRYRISMTESRLTCYVFRWVFSKITELASDLLLPKETITILSLVAGMSSSEGKWIPRRYRDLFLNELIRFIEWTEEKSSKSI